MSDKNFFEEIVEAIFWGIGKALLLVAIFFIIIGIGIGFLISLF